MGELSAEPSMEDILSSIKRIIAEEGDDRAPRARRPAPRPMSNVAPVMPPRAMHDDEEAEDPAEVLELSDPMPAPATGAASPRGAEAAPAADILSNETAQATRGALDALSRLMVKPEPSGDGTLEGLVREMLRPMLREWLDANLPALVEAIVAREIAKITGTR